MLIQTHRAHRDRDQHALTLRDQAMKIVNAHRPSYVDDFLIIEFRAASGDTPSGLDIWQKDDCGRKMLSVLWSDADAVVTVFRSGAWQRALARGAAGIACA